MDRGAWRAIVHGCAKSQTQGSDTHTHKSKLKCPKDNLKQDQHAVEKDNHKKKNALGD